MRKAFKKCIVACAAMCTIISATVFSVSASSPAYDTTSLKKMGERTSPANWNYTVHTNTRPNVGVGGAYVTVRTVSGTIVNAKTFPYYTNVSDLETTIPAGGYKHLYYIEPSVSGQRICGSLYIS